VVSPPVLSGVKVIVPLSPLLPPGLLCVFMFIWNLPFQT
jgi:hypothetical protein